MSNQAAICNAYFTSALDLSKGPGSALIGELLGEVAGEWLCIVEIERSDGQFSLVLDAAWAALGLQASDQPTDNANDIDLDGGLPRTALLAVVAGWPHDWDKTSDPEIGVHLSDDMIPHVSLAEIEDFIGNGQGPQISR